MEFLDSQLNAELDSMRQAGTYKHMHALTSPMAPVAEMEKEGEKADFLLQ